MGTIATINEAEKWNGGKINEDKKRHMEMRGGMERKRNKNDKEIWMRHIYLI